MSVESTNGLSNFTPRGEVIGFPIIHLVLEGGMGKILEFDEAASRHLEKMYLTPDGVAQRATVW